MAADPFAVTAPLILASASPRRRDLLAQIGVTPDAIVPADIDETVLPDESARHYVLRLAQEKAKCVAVDHPGAFVLGSDTTVCVGRRILGKPETRAEAGKFLDLMSGRRHRVYSAIALVLPDGTVSSKVVETRVRMKRFDADERAAYLDSEAWRGLAGGYAIQGAAGAFVIDIIGSYTNVVGLPLYETRALLRGNGYILP